VRATRLRALLEKWRAEGRYQHQDAQASKGAPNHSYFTGLARWRVYRQCADQLEAALLVEAEPSNADDLLADLRELERLYNTDRVAQVTSSQIERIFDKWLYDGPR
jgi:hypothetical protein